MSIGNWDPEAKQTSPSFQVDQQLLNEFIQMANNDQLAQLEQLISSQQQAENAAMMQQGKETWFKAAETFSDTDIEQLMRFFTLAEQLPGWEAGDKSPVIWLGKILKQRGTGINRELVLWIKSHTENRFLPHGPLL